MGFGGISISKYCLETKFYVRPARGGGGGGGGGGEEGAEFFMPV